MVCGVGSEAMGLLSGDTSETGVSVDLTNFASVFMPTNALGGAIIGLFVKFSGVATDSLVWVVSVCGVCSLDLGDSGLVILGCGSILSNSSPTTLGLGKCKPASVSTA